MLDCYWTLIGQVTSLVIIVKFCLFVWDNYSTYWTENPLNFSKHGKWSVVTGATDGIGKEIALQLAKRGQNIALISRTAAKLEKVAKEIESEYKVETKCLAVDFTEDTIYEKIESFLKEIDDIGVLVNNVGIAHPPMPFLEVQKEMNNKITDNIINTNVKSVFKMTGLVLPRMVNKGKGIIINISSMSAEHPIPYLSLYGATKACSDYFTKAIQIEYANKGIIIQTVRPGFVSTNMTKKGKAKPMYPAVKVYAEALMRTIGRQNNTNGYIGHAILSASTSFTPRFITNKAVVKQMKEMYGIK